jgi:hypothetical protein
MRHLASVLSKSRASLGRSLLSSPIASSFASASRVQCSMRVAQSSPASSTLFAQGVPAVPSRAFTDKVSEETPLTETVRTFLDPADFYKTLVDAKMDFFCGMCFHIDPLALSATVRV